MKISEIVSFLESWAPLALQEGYDNCGLQVGNLNQEVVSALITLDITEEIIEEAKKEGCNMIIAHHPVIFGGLKKITGRTMPERVVIEAIKNDIAIYAIHTNLDNVHTGVNKKIADILGLRNTAILDMKKNQLRKLVTYCPVMKLDNGQNAPDAVRKALWEAGAGNIGNYDQCSYNMEGIGTFRPLEGSDPAIGEQGKLEQAEETRIEVIFPYYLQTNIIKALWEAHPYEEVAYDLFTLENEFQETGSGMIGELEEPIDETEFIAILKQKMETSCVRYSPFIKRKIKKVAVCGGSGSFLLKTAIAKAADAFVTADFKYHQFFEAEGKILIADIGHYESEQFTVSLLYDKLREKFPNFALLKSKVNTNPINYA